MRMPTCTVGTPQEVCTLLAPSCDWDGDACTSRVTSYACPTASHYGLNSSILPPHLETPPDRILVVGGFVGLWLIALALLLLRVLPPSCQPRWRVAPRGLALSSRGATRAAVACGLSTLCLAAAAWLLPAESFAACAERGVCVYHMMFCEATRHGAALRHPANTLSNLSYV